MASSIPHNFNLKSGLSVETPDTYNLLYNNSWKKAKTNNSVVGGLVGNRSVKRRGKEGEAEAMGWWWVGGLETGRTSRKIE